MSDLSDKIIDVVLPLVEIEVKTPREIAFKRLLGTGFLVNSSRQLLTAAHVLKAAPTGYAVALRVVDQSFITIQLDNIRYHPTTDAAICDVNIPDHAASWINPTSRPHHQCADCHIWGYPIDVVYDGSECGPDGRLLQRPELVFTKTYIRRRITGSFGPFKGQGFYEIGDSAGAGCSGGPAFVPIPGIRWNAFGIYTGENISKTGDGPERFRGYITRMEEIVDWLAVHNVPVLA